MSVIHVAAFLVCWTPFLVIQLWHILDERGIEAVSSIVQDILFLLAYLNSCLNPIVYGGFYFKNFQKIIFSNGSQNRHPRNNLQSQHRKIQPRIHRIETQL